MPGDATLGRSNSQLAEPRRWPNDIIQAALLESSRIRLESLRGGERMYDEIVKAAHLRAEEMLSDARQEAQRIIADAHQQASMMQAQRLHEAGAAEAALEALKTEMANTVRQLRGSLREAAFGPDSSTVASHASEPLATQSISTNGTAANTPSFIVEEGTTPNVPDGALDWPDKGDLPRHPDRQWVPPEWISGE